MSDALIDAQAEEQQPVKFVPKTAFTPETAAAAGRASAAARAERKARELAPASDEEIEAGLRRRAATSAKDAEVLLRWLARPRTETSGLGLEGLSEDALEGLYAGLLRLGQLSEPQLVQLLAAYDSTP